MAIPLSHLHLLELAPMTHSVRGTAARGKQHLQDVNRWRAWAEARKDEAITVAQSQIDACRQCRECQCEVKLTERVCPNCGVRDPVRIPLTIPTVLGIAVVVALCALMSVL
jgi:uncharacterized paraquat-inducible protein A